VFVNGKVVEQRVGLMPKDELARLVAPHPPPAAHARHTTRAVATRSAPPPPPPPPPSPPSPRARRPRPPTGRDQPARRSTRPRAIAACAVSPQAATTAPSPPKRGSCVSPFRKRA